MGVSGAVVLATLLAWIPWRRHLDVIPGKAGFGARWIGVITLLLLLIDPGVRLPQRMARPLILLDNSVSMHRTGGAPVDSLATAARSRGDVLSFGELAPGIPGSDSRLGRALAAAVATDRPIEIITDGEIPDAASLAPDLFSRASVQLVPSSTAADIALSSVEMPSRLIAGDTLEVTAGVVVAGTPASSTVKLELRDGSRVLLTATASDLRAAGRYTLHLRGVLPASVQGDRWLQLALVGSPDAEPQNDSRWRLLRILPTPAIVVILESPDWDAKSLLAVASTVSDAAVRGYVQLQPGVWYRAHDLARVPLDQVQAATDRAELVLVRGDTTRWRNAGRARMLWPTGQPTGDWYATGDVISPISGAFSGVDLDSLPALSAARDVGRGEWVGATARRDRRGAAIPIIAGRTEPTGRTVVLGASGWYQWGFRGGEAEQVWRGIVAGAMTWLLATPAADRPQVTVIDAVVEQGSPARFQASGDSLPGTMPIVLEAGGKERTDTLRFNTDGVASLALLPGHYSYRVAGSVGEVMVEPWSRELLPSPPTIRSHQLSSTSVQGRRSMRELGLLFVVAVAAFSAEWLIRRRLGLA